ncbi:unnamed protein product [Taenia asiatica]|uniref:G-patch domain-containing protein n=1 Tax=Taenia asiatica TaxID=60517 RepID=A0A3P6PDF9_TAEAS|nr:unnamed protein product [Taenia asiatica]
MACYVCVSINGSNPGCEDPMHGSVPVESPCRQGRSGHGGLSYARYCVKIKGQRLPPEKPPTKNNALRVCDVDANAAESEPSSLKPLESAAPTRKRKSRWDSDQAFKSEGQSELSHNEVLASAVAAAKAAAQLAASGNKSAPLICSNVRQLTGGALLSEEQVKQIQYQKELQAMHEFILAQQRLKLQEQQLMESIEGVNYSKKPRKTVDGLEVKYEYDSDEDCEGGTWEHRLRAAEMEATRDWAEKLTEMGQGKHHIGDFLPPDELERFMETYRALKEGREPDYSEYKQFKLTCENVGFQMLEKMGWKEGEGLGASGQGIVNPVSKGNVHVEGVGLGVERSSNLSVEDDEFEAYRKRMMLAYRFRPNPLYLLQSVALVACLSPMDTLSPHRPQPSNLTVSCLIASLFDVLDGMSDLVSDEAGPDISVQYYCQKCKKPLDLASDFGSSRTSDLSSIMGSEYTSGDASSPTYSPISSLDHRLQVNAYLSDIINGRTEINHPMCQECADTLISAQQQLLDFQKEEIACLEVSGCEFQRGSLDEESPDSLKTSSAEVDEDGSYSEQLHAVEDTPAEAEESDATTCIQPHYTKEELLSLQQEFVRLQRESRLLDKQIATNEAALLVRQAELDRMTNEYNEQRLTLMEAEESLGVLDARLNDARYQFERLRRTNVLNTAFPIWYDGHIGVINGLHLGRLASKPVRLFELPPVHFNCLSGAGPSKGADHPRCYLSNFLSRRDITWPEINGALGQCAMLVTCLAKKLSYTFKNSVIIPMGSQSKIAALPNGTPLPLYNSSGSMRIFSSASFDNALVMLLDCVGQLQARVERPPVFCLPFKILDGGRIQDRSGSAFSIKCSTTTDENWTKALKMLLMDLKYLIAATVGKPERSTSKA